MDYVVAAKGDTQVKIVLEGGSLERQEIIPFVGVRRNGVCEVGLGFLNLSGQVKQFFARPLVANFVQSQDLLRGWRGMKIFETLTHVWEGTVKGCYDATELNSTRRDQRSFSHLADQVGWRQFDSFLSYWRGAMPKPAELDQMIQALLDAGLEFDIHEMQVAIREGNLTRTPLIQGFIQKEIESYRRLNAQERAQVEEQIRRLEKDPNFQLELRALAS